MKTCRLESNSSCSRSADGNWWSRAMQLRAERWAAEHWDWKEPWNLQLWAWYVPTSTGSWGLWQCYLGWRWCCLLSDPGFDFDRYCLDWSFWFAWSLLNFLTLVVGSASVCLMQWLLVSRQMASRQSMVSLKSGLSASCYQLMSTWQLDVSQAQKFYCAYRLCQLHPSKWSQCFATLATTMLNSFLECWAFLKYFVTFHCVCVAYCHPLGFSLVKMPRKPIRFSSHLIAVFSILLIFALVRVLGTNLAVINVVINDSILKVVRY